MSTVVNNDKITYVITSYGLSRIAEALSDPKVTLNLSKAKVGDANGNFYTPTENQTSLINPLPNGSFYISKKELLEDKLTVSFYFLIPESFGNCDIREVGLYETIDGVDYLFAVGTSQPIVKPSTDNNYLISVDYYIMLKSVNLSDVYDQIILNPDNVFVTEQDLQDLMSTFIFTQGNLTNQIERNSHVIGLNRAQTLYENIQRNLYSYSYVNVAEILSNILDVSNINSIFGFWSFNYPRTNTSTQNIKDLSGKNNSISTNKRINQYPLKYIGLSSAIPFANNDYFYIGSDTPLSFINEDGTDSSFTFIVALEPLSKNTDRTILARSNYATNTHVFEIKELANNSLEVTLFSDSANYIKFTSPENVIPYGKHSIILSYNSADISMNAIISGVSYSLEKTETGSYTHMNEAPTTLYCFTYTDEVSIYAKENKDVTELYNADGTLYDGAEWYIENGNVFYKNQEIAYNEDLNTTTPLLYAWTYEDSLVSHTIFTKDETINENTLLYNSDYTVYSGSEFSVALVDSRYVVQYETYEATADSSKNINSVTLYAFTYRGITQRVWADNQNNPTLLFDPNGNLYTGSDWAISNNKVLYRGKEGTYDSNSNVTIPTLSATSYITGTNGNIKDPINSNVSLMSIIKENMDTEKLRLLSLRIEASIGTNPCIIFS